MIAHVFKGRIITRGTIGGEGDLYLFDLSYLHARWEYRGKVVGETFIPADVQGYEHIPPEFYAALDQAWCHPNGFCEFPDPFLDNLEVAGT